MMPGAILIVPNLDTGRIAHKHADSSTPSTMASLPSDLSTGTYYREIFYQLDELHRYNANTCDPSQSREYDSDSTLPGKQKGLFAHRLFYGLDKDSALMG